MWEITIGNHGKKKYMTKSFLLVLFYCERKLSKSRTFIQHFLEIDFDVSASILLREENSGQTNKYSYTLISVWLWNFKDGGVLKSKIFGQESTYLKGNKKNCR